MKEAKKIRILFAGTPEFAATVLEKLINSGANIVGVLTAPDKPAGRGLHMQSSPVKILAKAHNIPVLQPEKLRDPDFQAHLQSLQPELGIVVAFRMLPETVWKMPVLGTFNLHASLLPAYRGAAPINRAIMAGEKLSGISTFMLQQEIDTGDLLLQEKIEIGENETAGSLYDRMMHQGADLVWKTVIGLCDESIRPFPQDDSKACPAPKIFRENCRIQCDRNAFEIHNQVRGLNPYPGAFLEHENKNLKIHASQQTEKPCKEIAPGTLGKIGPQELGLACGDFWLKIVELQPEGKRKMSGAEYLAGHPLPHYES